jgi:predicted nucleic acid-binding protein
MERRAAKVFLDSNVILSGLVSDRGSPRLILDILSLGLPGLRGVTGRYNLTEVERIIAGKLPAAGSVLSECLPRMDLEIVFLPFSDEMKPFHGIVDDKDLPVMVSAVIAKADYFLTGDKRLMSQLKRTSGLPFIGCQASDFLNQFLPDILAGRARKKEGR